MKVITKKNEPGFLYCDNCGSREEKEVVNFPLARYPHEYDLCLNCLKQAVALLDNQQPRN